MILRKRAVAMDMSMFSRFAAGLKRVYRAVKKPSAETEDGEGSSSANANESKLKKQKRPDDNRPSNRKKKRKFSIMEL